MRGRGDAWSRASAPLSLPRGSLGSPGPSRRRAPPSSLRPPAARGAASTATLAPQRSLARRHLWDAQPLCAGRWVAAARRHFWQQLAGCRGQRPLWRRNGRGGLRGRRPLRAVGGCTPLCRHRLGCPPEQPLCAALVASAGGLPVLSLRRQARGGSGSLLNLHELHLPLLLSLCVCACARACVCVIHIHMCVHMYACAHAGSGLGFRFWVCLGLGFGFRVWV